MDSVHCLLDEVCASAGNLLILNKLILIDSTLIEIINSRNVIDIIEFLQ